MEADFGFDVFSHIDQYEDYAGSYAADDAEDTVYPLGMIEDDEDDYVGVSIGMVDTGIELELADASRSSRISQSKSLPKPGRKRCKAQRTELSVKRKCERRGHGFPLSVFYELLLSWSVEKVRLDCRGTLGLGSLPSFTACYDSAGHFFDTVCATALEECRASIVSALAEHSKGPSVRDTGCAVATLTVRNCSDILEDEGRSGDGLVGLDCAVLSESVGAGSQMRPGCLLLLCLSGSKARPTAPSSSDDCSFLGTLQQQGASIAEFMGCSGTRSVPVWVNRQHFRTAHCRSAFSVAEGEALYMHCTLLCSVISYQRVCVTCYDKPSAPFLPKLLGVKASTHKRFDDDVVTVADEQKSAVEGVGVKECLGPVFGLEASDAGSIIDSIFLDLPARPSFPPSLQKYKYLFEGCFVSPLKKHLMGGFAGFTRSEMGSAIRDYVLSLNASQIGALADCLDSTLSVEVSAELLIEEGASNLDVGFNCGEVKCIQGPPGCGKTRFGISLLHVYLCCLQAVKSRARSLGSQSAVHVEPHRVMVTAASNKAVSVLVEEYLRSSGSSRRARWEGLTAGVGLLSCSELEEAAALSVQQAVACVDAVLVGVEDIVALGGPSAELQRGDAALWASLRTPEGMAAAVELHGGALPASRCGVDSVAVEPPLLPAYLRALAEFCAPSAPSSIYIYSYSQRASDALLGIELGLRVCEALCSGCGGDTPSPRPHACLRVSASLKQLFVYFTVVRGKLARSMGDLFAKVLKNTAYLADQKLRAALRGVEQTLVEGGRLGEGALEPEWMAAVLARVADARKYVSYLNDFLRGGKYESQVVDEALRTAGVIFCTLSTSGSAVVRRQLRSVDVLLVDEAGQASEGELVIPLFLRPLNLVLVGDPQQLPPTILSTENARLGWNVSSMERLMRHLDAPHRLLDTQYRMHPQISCFPNRQFYAGRLNDSEHVRTAVRPDFGCDDGSAANCVPGCFGSPFLFLDVKGLEQGGSRRGVSCSISNPAEATLVIKLCVSLCKSILDARGRSGCGDGGDLPQIRILTFYSAQVKVLKAQHQAAVLKEHASPLARYLDSIRVHSVDSFQGSEADCVLVSFVRSNAAQRVGFLKDFQRLNVALTRAKHLLLAVGDAATLGGTPLASTPAKNVEPDSDSLAALIKHCKQQRLLVDGAGLF